MKSGEKPPASLGAASASPVSVRRFRESAAVLRMAIAYVFSKPSGGSQCTSQRDRKASLTLRNTSAGPPAAVSPRIAASPVPVYSG